MGFPGALEVACTYRMKVPGTLVVELTASADEPTLCNLAHHSYFNLEDGGASDILDHRLTISASAYLPVDGELIPTGVVEPVDGTAFDFRLPRPIRMELEGEQLGYDHILVPAKSDYDYACLSHETVQRYLSLDDKLVALSDHNGYVSRLTIRPRTPR